MTFLPIVERELRLASRLGWTYWLRVVLGASAVVVVGMTLAFHLITGSRMSLGSPVFHALTVTLLVLCGFAGVFITADCLSEEKREGTLGLLFLTDLKGYDVVLGKLIATSLTSVSSLLSVVPVLGMVLFLGGVSPGEFWRMTLVFLNTLFFSLAAGLLASAVSVSERQARGLTFGLILLFGAGLPLAGTVVESMGARGVPALSAASPLTTWRMAFDVPYRMGPQRFWDSFLMIQLVNWTFIVLACLILPRRWQERAHRVEKGNQDLKLTGADLATRSARRRPLLDRDPVLWMVTRKTWPAWVFPVVSLTLVALVAVAWWMDSTMGAVTATTIAWVLALVIRVSMAFQSCRFFSEARRSGAFELLICTPLTTREMLRGQWLAIRRHHLIPVIAVLGLYAMGMVATFGFSGSAAAAVSAGGWMPVWIMIGWHVYPMLRFVADVFAVVAVGMLMGLTSRKPGHAVGLTILFTMVLPLVAFCIPNLIIDIPLALWAWDRLRRETRSPEMGIRAARASAVAPAVQPPRLPPVLKTG